MRDRGYDQERELGGGPQEYLKMMEQVARRVIDERSTFRSSTGSKGPQNQAPQIGLNPKFVGTGELVQFTYSAELLPTGMLAPGSRENGQGGLYEGAIYREFVSQRQIGWSREQPNFTGYSTETIDSMSGRVPEPIRPVDGLPVADIPANAVK